jgi:predicted dehydrogenase/threonine dehydrogenase-like Zn-dependent dehydrogenase
VITTLEAAFNKLDQPMVLGYSSAGTIIEVSEDLKGFAPGDRVACAGGNYAVHAEYGVVPRNLLVHLPDNVEFESAAFVTLGAIAMQGFRLAEAKIGENVCIIGLGLLGLLTAQIARAAGCNVFGIDIAKERVELAKAMGFDATIREGCTDLVPGFTRGRGFDCVLICADTHSNDPVELAGEIARDRATVVAIGAVGFNIPRKIYYEKELEFKVSRSYGPGRYDPQYEEKGVDYPLGYVRWTEGRNLESFVDLLSSGKVDVKPLITHRFPIDNATAAYELITGKTNESFLGVLLSYSQKPAAEKLERKISAPVKKLRPVQKLQVGVLGAGNYAQAVFLPILKKSANADLVGIATSSGLSAKHAAEKFGFRYSSSSEDEVLQDPSINALVILTRHNLHARQVVTALKNKKAVYCEKPLALTLDELKEIEDQIKLPESNLLTVGFNRRFAPMALQLRNFFNNRTEPMSVHYRVNAGFLPLTHWLHDPLQGGGRIVGEGCHFIDFLTYLIGTAPASVVASALEDIGKYKQDNVILTFKYGDGSVGTLTYLANGNKNFAKENVEVFCSGKIAVLNDFRTLELVTETKKKTLHSRFKQDKGHASAWAGFMNAVIQGGSAPIPYEQLIGTTRASFAAVEALRTGKEIAI